MRKAFISERCDYNTNSDNPVFDLHHGYLPLAPAAIATLTALWFGFIFFDFEKT